MTRPTAQFYLFLLILLFVLPSVDLTANSDIQLDILIGFNGIFKPGHWTPLVVTVENIGKSIRGLLQLDVSRGSEYRGDFSTTSYTRFLELPSNSRKRYSFVVFLESFTNPLVIRINVEEKDVLVKKVDLHDHAVSDKLVLGLSRKVSLDFLSVLPVNRTAPGGGRVRVLYPHIEYLPEKWHGYDSVGLIVIHDIALKQLRENQVEALRKWVSIGGVLVISGGAHFTESDYSVLKTLIPVEIVGRIELNSLSSLAQFFESEISTTKTFIVSNSRPTSGEVVIQEDGIPILVREALGRGKIIFMAFDFTQYPVYAWSGKPALWQSILRESKTEKTAGSEELIYEDGDPFEDSLIHPVLELPLFAFPSHFFLLGFIIVYLGIVFVLIKLKQFDSLKTWMKSLSIALVTAFFSLLGYFVFNFALFRGEMAFINISMLKTTFGQGYGELIEDVVLISNRRKDCSITIQGDQAGISQQGVYDLTIMEDTIMEDRGCQLKDVTLDGFNKRIFRVSSVLEFPVDGEIVRDGPLLRIRIKNSTNRVIRNGLFIYKGVPYFAGELEPGNEIEETFRVSVAPVFQNPVTDWESIIDTKGDNGKLMRGILGHIFDNIDAYFTQGNETVIFTGWVDSPLLPVKPDSVFFYNRKLTLIAVEMDTEGGSFGAV